MSLELAVRGVLLVLLGFVTVLSTWGPTRRREARPSAKISWSSIVGVVAGLVCIGLLRGVDSFDHAVEWKTVCLAVIPICVVFSSIFAVSYWEPVLMPWVLYLVPGVFRLMPVRGEIAPLEYLAVGAVMSLMTLPLGCLALFLSRKFRDGRWTWSLVRGLGWGLPCAVGSLFVLKNKISTGVAFHGDHTLVWVVLAEVVLVTAAAGIRRKPRPTQEDLPQDDRTAGAPLTQNVAASDWRAIRNYSDLFPGGSPFNYPVGVAFAITALVSVILRIIAYLNLSSMGDTALHQFLIGLVRALFDAALFVLISRWIRQIWLLPVVWGVVSETLGFITVVLLGAPVEWVARVSPYTVIATALFMAGLVFAVQAWGPRIGSLMTGAALSVVPLWIYGSIVSMPSSGFVMLLVNRLLFAVLFFYGIRYYFKALAAHGRMALQQDNSVRTAQ